MNKGRYQPGALRARLEKFRRETALAGPRGLELERSIVWMLGSPRSGSTWLLNLLAIHPRVVRFDEPGIGYHLGLFTSDVMGAHPGSFDDVRSLLPAARKDQDQYFFSTAYERIWKPRLRRLILARFDAQLRDATRKRTVDAPLAVVKEPAGSQAAAFLLSVLPASRLLFLARDPRDVLDSIGDAVRAGSWLAGQFGATSDPSPAERMSVLRAQALRWLARTEVVTRTYDRLPERQRYLVRYEDLRADTVPVLDGILRWLGLDIEGGRLAQAVEKLSFEALPETSRGEGKFARAADPGLWRKNLSTEEQAMIREILGEAMLKLGYDPD